MIWPEICGATLATWTRTRPSRVHGPALYWSQVTRAISTATTAIPAVATLRSRNRAVRKAPPPRLDVDFPEDETIGLLFGMPSDTLRATSSNSLAWRADASPTPGEGRVTVACISSCGTASL